ncbi:hypothetical protein [Billgrantia diversa]|nr:hypothetical protein [Halomonas sp. MCCC 1A13316]
MMSSKMGRPLRTTSGMRVWGITWLTGRPMTLVGSSMPSSRQ